MYTLYFAVTVFDIENVRKNWGLKITKTTPCHDTSTRHRGWVGGQPFLKETHTLFISLSLSLSFWHTQTHAACVTTIMGHPITAAFSIRVIWHYNVACLRYSPVASNVKMLLRGLLSFSLTCCCLVKILWSVLENGLAVLEL
jgi:hypothetical protein